MSILKKFQGDYESRKVVEMSMEEYLNLCKDDTSTYATAAERMLAAIGEPTIINTADTPELGRLFSNRKIKTYTPFSDFYGMEDTIERIVSFFKHAAQGLEEYKQILYLLGPVGSAKSSLAEKLKMLMESQPFYALKAGDAISPIYESPLGLVEEAEASEITSEYGIPQRYLGVVMSPWAVKRLREFDNDKTKFTVVKVYPSIRARIGITKTEPGDENNQDISSLVGKLNIRKSGRFDQDDPDCYTYCGGLNVTTQGMLEFVEMFKAPLKTLHPLLTSTQERNYNGTEDFGAIPYQGIVLAHSNESEWESFSGNKNNEAFLDRVYIVKVPYALRVDDEIKIYEKMINASELASAPCAPGTLEMMARFSVLTRLKPVENGALFSKLEVYNGKNLKDTDPSAKAIAEYRDFAGVDEGMSGFSTRAAFKTLSRVFNYDIDEVGANPAHLMLILEQTLIQMGLGSREAEYISYIKDILSPKYISFLEKQIQSAYLESYSEYGQNLFDNYIRRADAWIEDADFRDPETGTVFDRETLNVELEKIEKSAGISNPKDFRGDVVRFVMRAKANNGGKSPSWRSYTKLKVVIEKNMFSNTADLLPVISFATTKGNSDDQSKHDDFVDRMVDQGYTRKQVKILVGMFIRARRNN